jgi:CCR4-NOT transcription complex subunit 9
MMQQHFLHQQQFPSDWAQSHHQHPNHHAAQQHVQQQQSQAQAAAAAAHYNRIAGNNGTVVPGAGPIPRGPATEINQLSGQVGLSEDNQRVLGWIAELMKPATRETALLELSKKREQVPELALILWHSFGRT